MIDTHCHLTYPDFDKDRAELFARAKEAGVEALVTIGTGPDDWPRCIELAKANANVRVSLGLHPNEAGIYDARILAQLGFLARTESCVVAIGETGLDFFRDGAPRDRQYSSFQAHLDLAEELQKPFVLHCRAAENEMLEVLEKHRIKTGHALRGVWHCFTATKQFGLRAAEMGLHFGLGGVVTYPKANEVREALAALPEDRLLLETDCPFLPPQPWRGKRNEPSYLSAVVKTIADARGMSVESVRAATTSNSKALFGIDTWGTAQT